MRYILAAALLIIMVAEHADAQTLSRDELCKAGDGRVDRGTLVHKLYGDLSPFTFSDSLDGASRAIVFPSQYCKGPKCTDDARRKLDSARLELMSFWSTYGDGPPTRENLLAFLQRRKEAPAFCAQESKKAPPPPTLPPFVEQVRIRKKAADLPINRDDERFKPLERASFAASRDYIAASDSYDIDGVIGYKISIPTASRWFELIPYLSYTRQHVARATVADNTEVENVGGGVIAQFYPTIFGHTQDLYIYPQITHSTRTHVTVLSGNAVLTPNLWDFGFGRRLPIFGIEWLQYSITPQVKATYASLLDNGDASVIRNDIDSFRYGPSLNFWMGVTEGSLKGLGVTVSYDYMDLVTSGRKLSHVAQFDTTISYVLPKQEYWSLQLKYVDGRNLETFEKQRKVSLGLGLKY